MEVAVLPRVGEKGIRSVAVRWLRHISCNTEVRNEVEEIEIAFWRTHGYHGYRIRAYVRSTRKQSRVGVTNRLETATMQWG